MLKTLYKNVGVMPTLKPIDLLPFGVNFKVILEGKDYNGITTQEIVVPRWWTKEDLLSEITDLEENFGYGLTIKTWEKFEVNWDIKINPDEELMIKTFTGYGDIEFPLLYDDLEEIQDLKEWFAKGFPDWEVFEISCRKRPCYVEEGF